MMTPDFFNPAHPYLRRNMSANTWWEGFAWHVAGFSPPNPTTGAYHQYDHVLRSSTDDPTGEWQRLFGVNNTGDASWYGRCYVRACPFDGEIHIVAGYNDVWNDLPNNFSRVISDHLSIGAAGRRWSRWQKPAWEAREDVGLAASDTEMVMYGGVTYAAPHDDGARRVFKEIHKFPIATKKWEPVPIILPDWYKRRSALFEYHDGWYYIAGGGNASGLPYKSCMRFKLDGTIETLPMLTKERTISADCKAAGRLWKFFGRGLDGVDLSDYESLDLSNPHAGWTNHGPTIVPARYLSQPIVKPGSSGLPDMIYFIGGATDNVTPRRYYGDFHSFNTATSAFLRHPACTLDIDP